VIELKNISLGFGGKPVYENFSLKIPTDGVICITGRSGRGKTTLCRIIAALISPDGGEISGLPFRPAFMFQEDRLLPWLSALDNVSAVSNREAAGRWLGSLELSGDVALFPAEMSGGMKRRTALARALAYDGDFLILDEPFTGLDPALCGTAAKLILSRGLPGIAVTHSPREVSLLGGRAIEI
jgi:NitT/TauT family transport system ATP-binding protein